MSVNFAEVQKLHDAAIVAEKARKEKVEEYLTAVMEGIIEKLPEKLSAKTLFLPKPQPAFCVRTGAEVEYNEATMEEEEHNYGDDTHFYASIPINSAIRCFLDGNEVREDIEKLLLYLMRKGYIGENGYLADTLENPAAMAFITGYFASGTTEALAARKICSGYEKDFEKGEAHGRFKGLSSKVFLTICLYLSADGQDSSLMAKVSEERFPHSEMLGWNIQCEPVDDGENPSNAADLLARRLITKNGCDIEPDDYSRPRM